MKKLTVFIAVVFVILSGIASANPIPFQSIVDFSGGGTDGSITYANISEANPFSYNHIINFSPDAYGLCNVTLAFTHKGNQSSTQLAELWFLQSNSNVLIGNLSDSGGVWVTDTFNISSSLYPALPASSWTFAILLSEGNSNYSGRIAIDKSVLSGNYNCTAVPEPATLLLLGFGLIGLAGIRKK